MHRNHAQRRVGGWLIANGLRLLRPASTPDPTAKTSMPSRDGTPPHAHVHEDVHRRCTFREPLSALFHMQGGTDD